MPTLLVFAALAVSLAGCALPTVALGGRVSFASARGGEHSARSSVHSALWIAVRYEAGDGAAERERRATPRAALEPTPAPCAIEVACAWEQQAAYEAQWARASTAPEREGELSP